MSHIIGRPDDNMLDILLGDGAEPEQAIIGGGKPRPAEGGDPDDDLPGDEPTGR